MREKERRIIEKRGFPPVGKMECPPRPGIQKSLPGVEKIPGGGRGPLLVGHDRQFLPSPCPLEDGEEKIPSVGPEQPLRAQEKRIRGALPQSLLGGEFAPAVCRQRSRRVAFLVGSVRRTVEHVVRPERDEQRPVRPTGPPPLPGPPPPAS